MINIIIVILLACCSFMDMKYRKISTHVLVIFAIPAILFWIEKFCFNGMVGEIKKMCTDILPGLLLLVLGKATGEKIGYGDGYLFVIIGIYIGFSRTISILFTAFFVISIMSIILLMFRKINRNTEIPFIPVVLISFLIQFIL